MPRLILLPSQQEVHIPEGSDILEIKDRNPDLPLVFGCRRGDCGTCAVRVIKGGENLTRLSEQERKVLKMKKLDDGEHRLACQCAVNGDVTVLQNLSSQIQPSTV